MDSGWTFCEKEQEGNNVSYGSSLNFRTHAGCGDGAQNSNRRVVMKERFLNSCCGVGEGIPDNSPPSVTDESRPCGEQIAAWALPSRTVRGPELGPSLPALQPSCPNRVNKEGLPLPSQQPSSGMPLPGAECVGTAGGEVSEEAGEESALVPLGEDECVRVGTSVSRWERCQEEAMWTGDWKVINARPVIYWPRQNPQFQGLPYDVTKELRQIVKESGISSSHVFSLEDVVKDDFNNPVQIWLTDFRENCTAYANDLSSLQVGVTCNHLMGERAYTAPESQAGYPRETYEGSLNRYIENENARELFFRQLAYENANQDCRRALQTIPERESCMIAEMVRVFDQWPLKKEWLVYLRDLVQELLNAGHIVPTSSPWNTPVFCVPKQSGRWCMLQDLRAVNSVLEPRGALQLGLPSPAMLPAGWLLMVIDLKDCFFTIFLHPDNAPCFAFSIPPLNHTEPMQRYHWVFLPQEMHNSPIICQTVVAKAIHPVRKLHPSAIIYHYMDDILVTTATETELQSVITALTNAVQEAGLQVAPEKIQRSQPWAYLGWRITQQEITPQPLMIKVKDTLILNDLQRLLRAINWLRPTLHLTTEELHPLFELLKGDPYLTSIRSLTTEAKQALKTCSQVIESRQGRRQNPELHICLALVHSRFQPFAVLFQWDQAESDPLRILEWLFLPHSAQKTV
ncbi:LOW QUALITY PROTEIN: uncharacterized protein LOC135407799 [Pseudopipra pipra]|uniref:LOW QUALITY PROTEIN: uncharacterized protein LOC135407799 n=1 Tax=Pseudopipra pipra TaxID=415032 RepID=UPI003139D915